jgi:hypothetical protein
MAVLAKEIQKSRPDFVNAAHAHPIAKPSGTRRKSLIFPAQRFLDKGGGAVHKVAGDQGLAASAQALSEESLIMLRLR